MSIDDIKKKAKLSLDEMHDNKSVGNPEKNPERNINGNGKRKKEYNFPSHLDGLAKRNMPFKMTFNVNEDTFDAFNEIYAQRMIDGNKTEKSVLICEAIKLLYEKETK